MKKTAVVLLNLGGPSSPDEIYPFLFSLFYDPAILSFPNPVRYGLAKLIARMRLPEAQRIYASLGGRSPLLDNTKAQAVALESFLGENYRVFVAMRHAFPSAEEAVKKVKAYGPDEIVLLPLYPQYSRTTTASSFKEWEEAMKGWRVSVHLIPSYPCLEGFLEALKDLILPAYKQAQKQGVPRVLLTAHGLPEKFIKKGDPYQKEVIHTATHLIEKLSFLEDVPVVCYQSRVGPLKWIGPSLEEEIIKAVHAQRPLVVVPLSFVSEHSETLVELDILMRDLALKEGCPAYERVPTVGIHPLFIQGLAELVKEK